MIQFKRLPFFILFLMLGLSAPAWITLYPNVSYAKTSEKSLKKKLNKATALYDNLEIEDAEDVLTDAISEAASNNISGATVARLHIMLGVVRYASSGEEQQAEEQFVEAVRAFRKIDIPEVYRTPDLEKILKRALVKVPPEDKTTNTVLAFNHTPIDVATAGKPLVLNIEVPAEMPVYKAFVHLRRFEEGSYNKFEMAPDGATRFTIEVPSKEIRTSQIDYYITAEDRAGSVIAESGKQSEPHNVVVMGSGNVQEKPEPNPNPELPGAPSQKWFYTDLTVGTGAGFLTGGENNRPTANPTRDVTGGLAFAFGHANLGFGAILNQNMQLGLEFRFQFAPTQDLASLENSLDKGSGFWDTEVPCFGTGAPLDCMARLKYKYFFTNSIFYSSVGAGVGRVRNWLQLKSVATSAICDGRAIQTDANGNEYCLIRDTVRTGWVHFGLGGGMAYPLSDSIAFYTEAFLMILVPQTSINLDVQGGLEFRF